MPSRRQSSAMLSSPRRPSSTTRIFSSAEKCRRVARRMSFTTSSAGDLTGPDLCLIFAPSKRYDEPEILSSSIRRICLIGADGGQHGSQFGCGLVVGWALGERGSAAVFLDFRRPQPSEAVLVDRRLPGEEFFDGQSVPLARFFQVQ